MASGKPIGVSGVAAPGGYLQEREPNSQLRGVAGFGSSTSVGWFEKQAAQDGVATSCVMAAVLPIAQAPHEIQAPEGVKPEVLDFVQWAFLENLKPGLPTVLRGIARPLLTFGHHVCEPVFARVQNGRWAGKITLRTLAPRPAWTIERFDFDPSTGELAGIEQGAWDTNGRWTTPYLAAHEVVVFTHDQEGDDPTGRSMLRPCFIPLQIKGLVLRLIGVRNEREALGIPIATTPAGFSKEDRRELEKALQSFRAHEKGYLIVPDGVTIQLPEGKTGASDAMRSDLAALNLEVRSAFLQNWQSLGTTETGSRAVGEVQADPYYLALVAIASEITDPLNELIERLVDANFGPQDAYPYFAPPKIRQTDVGEAIKPILDAVKGGGLTDTPDVEAAVRERIGLEPLDEKLVAAKWDRLLNPPAPVAGPGEDPNASPGAPGAKQAGVGAPKQADPEGEDAPKAIAARAGRDGLSLSWHPPRLLTPPEQRVAFAEISARFDSAGRDLQQLVGDAIRRNRDTIRGWGRKFAKAAVEDDAEALAAMGRADLPRAVRESIFGAVEAYAADVYRFGRDHAERERRLAPGAAERDARKAAEAVREEIPAVEGEPGPASVYGFADPKWSDPWSSVRTEAQIHSDSIADELLRYLRLAISRASQTQPRARAPDGSRDPYNALDHVLDEIDRVVTVSSESSAIVRDAALATSVKAFSGGRDEVFAAHEDEIASVEYSAVMDPNTCGECESWDKRGAPSFAAAEEGAIPPTPNPNCAGTANRCRCIWVVNYKD